MIIASIYMWQLLLVFFHSDLNLHSSVFNTGCIEERKTADALAKVVADVPNDFGLSMNKLTVLTDNASYMTAAFWQFFMLYAISCAKMIKVKMIPMKLQFVQYRKFRWMGSESDLGPG